MITVKIMDGNSLIETIDVPESERNDMLGGVVHVHDGKYYLSADKEFSPNNDLVITCRPAKVIEHR